MHNNDNSDDNEIFHQRQEEAPMILDDEIGIEERKEPPTFKQRYLSVNMFSVVMLGLSFCTFFTAFNTTQAFITSIKKDLGFWSLAVLYFFFAIFNIVSPAVVARAGPRISLILGSVTYSLFVLACCFKSAWLLIGAAVLLGWGASTLWTAHGQFLTDIAGSDLGMYSGIFFAIFQSSSIIGNVITGVLFGVGVSVFWVFFILFCISVFGVGMLFTLFIGAKSTSGDGPEKKKKKKKTKSIEKSIHDTLRVMLDLRMVIFLPISLYSGYSISVFTGVLPPIIEKHGGKSMISWVMILFGVAEAVGSVVFGKLIDMFGRRFIMFVTLAFHAIAMLFVWLMLYAEPYLFFVTLFMCGLADSGLNTSIYSILGSNAYFKKRASDAFAAFKLVQSIASAAGFLSSNFAATFSIKIAVSISCGLAIAAFTILEFLIVASDKEPNTEVTVNNTSSDSATNGIVDEYSELFPKHN